MNLVKSTGTFGFYTIISRLLGYLRDVLIAIFLGTSFIADVFFVAFRIPNTFRRLFAEGTFNAAFVPSYTSESVISKSRSKKFANQIFNLLFIFLLFIVLIVEVFMPSFVGLIAPGFVENTKKIELAIDLTRITFPFLMFVSLSSFFGAVLNSHNKFAAASAAPIILNLILIGILFFGKYLNDELIYYLSYGVSAAGFLQLIFLYKFTHKFLVINFDFKLKFNNKVKGFFKKLLPSIFSSGVTQINILIGTIIASFQASAVSYLYYADRIYQINLAIAGIAIGVVVLPQLSKHIYLKKKEKILKIQNKALELSMFLSLPASIANNDTKTPFYISLISVILNILISVYYFKSIGFIIIPIATTIASWFNSIVLFIYLKKRNLFQFNSIFVVKFFKIVFATITMGIFFKYLILIFENKMIYDFSFKSFYLILSVLLCIIFYLLVSFFIKAFNYKDLQLKY